MSRRVPVVLFALLSLGCFRVWRCLRLGLMVVAWSAGGRHYERKTE